MCPLREHGSFDGLDSFAGQPSADARVPPKAHALFLRGELGGEPRAEVVQIARSGRCAIDEQTRNWPEVHGERTRYPIEILGGCWSNARGDLRRLRR
jgi:hypothetical protein